MKSLFKTLFYLIIIALIIYYRSEIVLYVSNLLDYNPKVTLSKPNQYYKNTSYNYVKDTNDFTPYSKSDLRNIIYSFINRGYETVTFYCPNEYTDCLKDFNEIVDDPYILSIINGFASPFNSFKELKEQVFSNGEITLTSVKLYNKDDINEINNKIDEILNSTISDNMTILDKVLNIHDYIVNNTKYDTLYIENKSEYKSFSAYGTLIQGHAICAGYSDAMALFLDRLNIPNYRISTDTHTWNAIKLDDKWYHLDLTWDDPVTVNSDVDTLSHNFYLIDTNKLMEYATDNHNFNKVIYREFY